MKRGSLFIVSAPSGAGKTTLLGELFKTVSGLFFSVSHTTRPPRPGEMDGRDYHFVGRQDFQRMRDEGLFLEWAEVHGNFYGTSRAAVDEVLDRGGDIILDIDVQGARQVRAKASAISVFIIPPSMQALAARLRGRGTDDERTIELRLQNAVMEMEAMEGYDHIVVNDTLDEAAAMLRAVVLAQRSKDRRMANGTPIKVEMLAGHG